MSTNIAESVKARLLNKGRGSGTEFELLLVRYGCERFLYRLGQSAVGDRCILKGATLLALWMKEPHRATRDIDLLAFGASDEQTVRKIVTTVCSVPCEEDGITFDLGTLRISPIRENQRYQGQRARLRARLGTAQIALQIDFGFGNAVTSVVDEESLPTLISGVPVPSLRTYPRVATIAEKFETMVQLGTMNSRMKDFYDVWALSETFQFGGAELQEAVAGCFERRGTAWTLAIPDALTSAFYSNPDLQMRWRSYGQDGQLLSPPPSSFEEIGNRMQSFLGPVRESIMADVGFQMHWSAGGPWRPDAASTA
ncbi:MAG: nucleotidyl transferase AbiEii/AbiGii toxin family protein [Dehalococcoidia bacterium]|nr:nucleotidyl transferase AbiEii/AbiGii toxin family protein [Dehalococcoidia bacterium]